MAFRHRHQARRFELKYVVDPGRARAIRDYLAGYLTPDEHSGRGPERAYPICSLYLDTRSLALYQQTCEGLKNRFKLRMRFYSSDPSDPVFLEVKRRETDAVCKERVAVTREGAQRLLSGARLDPSHLFRSLVDAKSASALECFCRLRDQVGAGPTARVSYMREAYVSPTDDRLRITFDRQLFAAAPARRQPFTLPRSGCSPGIGGVILEIKFTDSFPLWVSDMAQIFDIQRRSVAKYVYCVEALDLNRDRRQQPSRGHVA